MISESYMNDMLAMIEHLVDRLEETGDRRYAVMLEAMVNGYEAKLKQQIRDEEAT